MQKTLNAVVKPQSDSTKHFVHLAIVVTVVVCWLCGCTNASKPKQTAGDESEAGVVTVYVVNYPLKYFAERIGGEHVRVIFPAPPDEDPAFWMPDAETIAAYQQADLILLNGASYAKWTRSVSLPATKMVDTSASVSDQYISIDDAVTHAHGPGGEHAHTGTAFTTWLDPALAIAQAAAIREALTTLQPQHKATFDRNFAALDSDLLDLDAKITELVLGKSDQPIFFSHPVYQYLQRRYKLNGKSVHWEPEEVPSKRMWEEFAAMLEQHPARFMLWEGAAIEENVKRLDELRLQSAVYDPCGNVPEDGDLLSVMQQNVENLARALAE